MSDYKAFANSIILQIDEATRTIKNNGTNNPIILGVKGDDCAERIYFESPKQLSPEIDLLEQSEVEDDLKTVKVHVYVNFKNADNETYIHECSDVAQSVTSDMVDFSWLVSNKATIRKGDVKFNICIKKECYDPKTEKWIYTNEWHTTTFIGKVLDGVDVSKNTLEVITHDSVSINQLNVQVQTYANYVDTLNTNVIPSAQQYAADIVDEAITDKLASYSNTEAVDAKIDESISELSESIAATYLPFSGGQMSGNIEFSYGGIAFNNPESTGVGGFKFDIDGTPVIISDTLTIKAGADSDPFLAEYTYNLPRPNNDGKQGTLALIEDIPEVPKYHEHRITIFSNNDDTFAYARFVSKSDHPISGITELAGVIRSYVKAIDIQTAIMATGLSKSSVESECGPVCSLYAYSETELRLTYIDSSYDMQFRDVTETDWSTSDEVVEIN